jgi:hypothetical protein
MDFDGNQNRYAVEVSGWDASDDFFVEKTDLTWTAEGMKELNLHRSVREGSVIFVRLMQPVAHADNYPIACQAVKVMEHAPGGCTHILLSQLRPRAFFKDTVNELNSTRVA